MSETRSPSFDRRNDWRRWQMEELPRSESGRNPDAAESPTAQQRKAQAAKKAAEQARQREQQELRKRYDEIRREAQEKGYHDGFSQGHGEGLNQGLEEGRQQARKELDAQMKAALAPIEALAKHFSQALEKLDEEIAHDLVELALATGRQLAEDALEASPEHILDVVQKLLHTDPPLTGQQRLWLNPEDCQRVAEHLGQELEAAGWKLQPDAQLGRGGCRITNANGELDATFESRWQAVKSQARQRPPAVSSASS
ncbi:flagellar assembly protein FliH [Halomonas sp. Bachu 37]|uniref:flagellar assembly protein FliH n=1 Tax=Halomonas kashgarensis TaxID=3084920 RepID=UPI003216AD54